MEWQIEYILDDHIIYVKTKGSVTAEAANLMVKEIVEAAACHQCDRQIVDHRNSVFAFSLFELYERPEVNMRIEISRKWKTAMVFRELNENTLFMETVFRNRGYDFHQFNDIERARTWVNKKKAYVPSFCFMRLYGRAFSLPPFDGDGPLRGRA